jgi:hypothetical protein
MVAEDEKVAAALVDFAGRRVGTGVILDVPDQQGAFSQWLEKHGFERERPLMRMILGSDSTFGDPRRMSAIAGPELG